MKTAQRFFKRQMDFWGALAALILLAPLLLAIALLIKLETPGPVFYRRTRVGKDGRPLSPFKFRTMAEKADRQGLGLNVQEGDSRITRAGKVLRAWGLDEFPQLLNVLKGEMSLIGPRPMLPEQAALLNEEQKKRLVMKPGMGGLALVKGRNALTWAERIAYDVEYVEKWNLLMDLKLIFQTLWVVLVKRRGLYEADAGLEDEFNKMFHA